MVDNNNTSKRATSHACLALHKSGIRIQPRFLRRNIGQILDSHEALLRRVAGDPPPKEMVANIKRDWGWDFPTTGMLNDWMRGNKPNLQIESLQLRQRGLRASTRERSRTHANDRNDLQWLPDPAADAVWPCTVTVSVMSVQPKKQVYIESQPAKILQRSGETGSLAFDIDLVRPFSIEIDQLFVVTETGFNGSRSWKKTLTTSYVLDISTQCQDSHDMAEFLSRLEKRPCSAYDDALTNEGVLKATWEGLPTCPQSGHMLQLRRAKGHRLLQLDYMLSAEMGWISRCNSLLKLYNRVYEAKKSRSPSTPVQDPCQDNEKTLVRHRIEWNFQDNATTRSLIVKVLSCPFCRDGKHFTRFERLMLHCQTYHSHFTFDPEYSTPATDDALFRATIAISLAPQSEHAEDASMEMDWVAPARPFNLRAHIRREDNWTSQSRPKGRKRAGRPRKEHNITSSSSVPPSRKRPAPDEIPDLPHRAAKRHCVPHVPSVSFYRTASKRPVQPGEYLADSDNEIDESWLAQKEGSALEGMGITGAAKQFTIAFHQHLKHEQSESSMLARDAILRFVRSYRERLKDADWGNLFCAKLKQLRKGGIIGGEIVTACAQILSSVTPLALKQIEGRDTADGAENVLDERSGPLAAPVGSRQRSNGMKEQSKVDGSQLHTDAASHAGTSARVVVTDRKKWTGGKSFPNGSQKDMPLPAINMRNEPDTPKLRRAKQQKHNRWTVARDTVLDPPSLESRTERTLDSLDGDEDSANDSVVSLQHDMEKPSDTLSAMSANLCFCGQSANDTRGTIACRNSVRVSLEGS